MAFFSSCCSLNNALHADGICNINQTAKPIVNQFTSLFCSPYGLNLVIDRVQIHYVYIVAAENGFVNLHHINIRKSAYASRTKFHNKCFKPTAKCLYFDGLCDGTYQKAIMVNFLILYACARVAYKREYAPAWEELLYMMSFTKMYIVSRRFHGVGAAVCSDA